MAGGREKGKELSARAETRGSEREAEGKLGAIKSCGARGYIERAERKYGGGGRVGNHCGSSRPTWTPGLPSLGVRWLRGVYLCGGSRLSTPSS